MRIASTIIALMLLVPLQLRSQATGSLDTRLIVMNYGDSSVNTSILNVQPKYKPVPGRFYYWYRAEKINVNKGGYAGYLLDGAYMLYDKHLNLIEKGFFKEGLKNGCWKRWRPDGSQLSETNWKDGLLEGISLFYNPDGSVYMSTEYKNGKKDGISVHFEQDSLVKQVYKNGEETRQQPPVKHRLLIRHTSPDSLNVE